MKDYDLEGIGKLFGLDPKKIWKIGRRMWTDEQYELYATTDKNTEYVTRHAKHRYVFGGPRSGTFELEVGRDPEELVYYKSYPGLYDNLLDNAGFEIPSGQPIEVFYARVKGLRVWPSVPGYSDWARSVRAVVHRSDDVYVPRWRAELWEAQK